MRVVHLQVVEEDVCLLLLHASTQGPEEIHEVWSLDWQIPLKQCHNSPLNIDCSHNSNAFEADLCFVNLQRSISCLCPVSSSNLIARKACFIDKDNVRALLDQPDHLRKHGAFAFVDRISLCCSYLLIESHYSKLYLIQLVNSSQLWDWQLSAWETYCKQQSSLLQRESHPRL